ncbi:MAG TPA: hypothetical protein VL652_12560 [Kutzneria sp.]|nr:hypothetical protein [Kutzneria sp.]
MTHRDLPASGRGCFAAVMIAPIAAFAGLIALTTLLNGQDEPNAGPAFGLPHPTRASQTTSLDTDEQEAPGTTIAEQPLALHKPVTSGKPPAQTTSVTVPSTVVAPSLTTATTSKTPCTGRTSPSATTSSPVATTTTSTTPPSAKTSPSSTPAASTTTVAPTTTSVAPTTSPRNAGVPKRVPPRLRPHA